jgi:hypothetical protein
MDGVGACDLTAGDIYNMIRCLDYQSCEVDNWVETDAYWLLNTIKSAAANKMSETADVQWDFDAVSA